MKEYRINYEEMFDFLLDGKPYKVILEYRNLAIQAVKAKFGFRPEVEITSDCKYAIIIL